MAHKFDPKHMQKLDNPERRKILPPIETLKKLGFKPNDVLADIGAGIGYFTIPSLQITDSKVETYAIDTSKEMLDHLKQRELELTGKSHIQTVLTDEYDIKLTQSVITFALMVNVLHEIDDKKRFIIEVKKIMAIHGKLAILDWQKVETPSGPPLFHRISMEETKSLLQEVGFIVVSDMKFGDEFYGVVAIK